MMPLFIILFIAWTITFYMIMIRPAQIEKNNRKFKPTDEQDSDWY